MENMNTLDFIFCNNWWKESTNLTNNNLCLYFQFQRLIIEEKETEKNAVDTATLMGGPKGKKGKGKGALRGKGKKKRGGGPNNIARMPVM